MSLHSALSWTRNTPTTKGLFGNCNPGGIPAFSQGEFSPSPEVGHKIPRFYTCFFRFPAGIIFPGLFNPDSQTSPNCNPGEIPAFSRGEFSPSPEVGNKIPRFYTCFFRFPAGIIFPGLFNPNSQTSP